MPTVSRNLYGQFKRNKHKHPLSKQFFTTIDTFVCFKSTCKQLGIFQSFLNSLHPNIIFTTERENNQSINFVDFTLTKINKMFPFSENLRAQTLLSIKILFTHINRKCLAYSSMIHRLKNISLSHKTSIKN